MKSYGIKDGGFLHIEELSSLPSWTNDDKGRLVWITSENKFYFGAGSTWEEVGNTSTITLGSDADGDMYYRNNDGLTRLPKGTSNQKLFMDGNGNFPTWSKGIAFTSTNVTIDLTGSVSYNVGFKPSTILCFGSTVAGTGDYDMVFGFGDSALNQRCSYYESADEEIYTYNSNISMRVIKYLGTTYYQSVTLSAFTSTGFTFNYQKTYSNGQFAEYAFPLYIACLR